MAEIGRVRARKKIRARTSQGGGRPATGAV